MEDIDLKIHKASKFIAEKLLALRKDERVLILTNPGSDLEKIAESLVYATYEIGAKPDLLMQQPKNTTDHMEPHVLEAFKRRPDVYIGVNMISTGGDPEGQKNNYKGALTLLSKQDIRFYLLEKKLMRAVWLSNPQISDFAKLVFANYGEIEKLCKIIEKKINLAKYIIVKNGADTELTIDVSCRKAILDEGCFAKKGFYGNLPVGEVFISPKVGASEGKIKIDVSVGGGGDEMALSVKDPIELIVEKNKVVDIRGGKNALILANDFLKIERNVRKLVRKGYLDKNTGKIYIDNMKALGEFGMGVNKKCNARGINNMEDEKAFGTAHIAFGANYDGDQKALNHMDAVMKSPEVCFVYPNGKEELIVKNNKIYV